MARPPRRTLDLSSEVITVLDGKRIAILAENLYEDLELWYPALRLREAGAQVTIVGPAKGERYLSKHDLPVLADAAASEVQGADFDAVIVPGGYAPDLMRRHEPMVRLVRDADAAGNVVAAICHGGWLLASAGIVRGRRLTSFVSIKDDLVNAGAQWEDAEVVADGNLITSRHPGDLPAFCRAVVAALAGTPLPAAGDRTG